MQKHISVEFVDDSKSDDFDKIYVGLGISYQTKKLSFYMHKNCKQSEWLYIFWFAVYYVGRHECK